MKSYVFPNMLDVEPYYTIASAMSSGLIPKSYHSIFQRYCKCTCESPIVINANRTIMKCSNPNCTIKLANRYADICKNFVTGIGPETAKSFIVVNKITNMSEAINNSSSTIKEYIYAWLKQPHYVSDILKFLSLPNIGVTADDLFDNKEEFDELDKDLIYTGLIELYSRLLLTPLTEAKFRAIADLLDKKPSTALALMEIIRRSNRNIECNNEDDFIAGIKTLGVVRYVRYHIGGDKNATKVALTLVDHWEDIKFFLEHSNLKNAVLQVTPLVITGDIIRAKKPDGSSYLTKESYVNDLNMITEELGFKFKLGSALVSTKFIVADTSAPTRKYLVGKDMGKLITSDELMRIMLKVLELKREGRELK